MSGVSSWKGFGEIGNALLELINDILDLSRIEADKLVLERADCPLRQIIDDVITMTKVRAEKNGLSLVVDYQWPLPETIHTDPTRLRQILVNLVGNSVKFTKQGEVHVSVGFQRDDNGSARMQFAVSDTGIGIPSEKIDELFQPFMQVDGSVSRRYGGTGLGLVISSRLAKALGGTIEVASQLGKGSTFTLTIDAGPLKGVPDAAIATRCSDHRRTMSREARATLAWAGAICGGRHGGAIRSSIPSDENGPASGHGPGWPGGMRNGGKVEGRGKTL